MIKLIVEFIHLSQNEFVAQVNLSSFRVVFNHVSFILPTIQTPLRWLTEYRNKSGDVSTVVAVDDLTNMKLEAGQVKEARGK